MKAVVLGAAAGGGSLSPAALPGIDGVFAALIGLPVLASAWKPHGPVRPRQY
jgi:hypothetical protein